MLVKCNSFWLATPNLEQGWHIFDSHRGPVNLADGRYPHTTQHGSALMESSRTGARIGCVHISFGECILPFAKFDLVVQNNSPAKPSQALKPAYCETLIVLILLLLILLFLLLLFCYYGRHKALNPRVPGWWTVIMAWRWNQGSSVVARGLTPPTNVWDAVLLGDAVIRVLLSSAQSI